VFEIRDLSGEDSLIALTELLHSAYSALGAMGLNYTAVDQSVENTAERIGRGRCLVAVDGSEIVGTILLVLGDPRSECPYYTRPGVAGVHQFGVLPGRQGQGIGSALLRRAEELAQAGGCSEVALDTAEPAGHLIEYYGRRGYRPVAGMSWPGKRYKSVILSKRLDGGS
jgi:GNAT superfamily N-acetyltransferase